MIKMLDVVGGTAGAGGVLGLESLFRPLVLVLAMGIALFVLVLGLADQRFLMGAGLLLYAAQMFNGAVVPVSANGYAALALVCVLLAGILRKRLPRFGVLVTGVFPAIYVYLALALLLLPRSVDMGESLKSIFLLVYLIVFCWCLLSAADGEDVRVVLRWTSGLVVAISMVLVIVMPSAAIGGYELDIVANRWRGLTQNPNALSTYAALFFLTAGTMTAAMVSLAPALVVMFGTASRAAALALGIVAGPQLLRGWGGTIKRLSVAVALVVAIPLLWTVLFSESTPTGGHHQPEPGSDDQHETEVVVGRGRCHTGQPDRGPWSGERLQELRGRHSGVIVGIAPVGRAGDGLGCCRWVWWPLWVYEPLVGGPRCSGPSSPS
jgi:hypothetical protein